MCWYNPHSSPLPLLPASPQHSRCLKATLGSRVSWEMGIFLHLFTSWEDLHAFSVYLMSVLSGSPARSCLLHDVLFDFLLLSSPRACLGPHHTASYIRVGHKHISSFTLIRNSETGYHGGLYLLSSNYPEVPLKD